MEDFKFSEMRPREFERHIQRHLPWHDMVSGVVCGLIEQFTSGDGLVVNFGSSTGILSRKMEYLHPSHSVRITNVEPVKEFIEYHRDQKYMHDNEWLRQTMQNYLGNPNLKKSKESMAICMMTLSFINPIERKWVIHKLFEFFGTVIIIDKVKNDIGRDVTRILKRNHGMYKDELLQKEQALRNVQGILKMDENVVDGYKIAGVRFFQMGDFEGYLYHC